MTVGAFADVMAAGSQRLAIALGIGIATVAVAGRVFLVITRSVLDPLDELLAATRRVRDGDLATRIPIVEEHHFGQRRLAAPFASIR